MRGFVGILAMAALALAGLEFGGRSSVDADRPGASGGPFEPLATSGETPLDEACKTGCEVGNHPITPLAEFEFAAFVESFADADLAEEERERALETLLFHGARSRELIARHGLAALDAAAASALRRELSRTHARLWLRIVGDDGVVRASLEGARMPVGVKEHVHVDPADPDTRDALQPFEVSGTIHRTGVRHLWARL